MIYSAVEILNRHRRAELKYLDMFGFHQVFKPLEIDHPFARSPMVLSRKHHIVNMEPGQPLGHSLQMHPVINKTEIFLNLCMTSVMPICHRWIGKLFKKEREIRFERDFLQCLAVFDP